jgi:hypothetical protein
MRAIESNQEWFDPEFDLQGEGPFSEEEELELAAELLSVNDEYELDQFLGKVFRRVGRGFKKAFRPLGGVLKSVAKKALPIVGGALGSFIPVPGVGTAVGSAVGGALSRAFEMEFEGIEPEEEELEMARRFVRLAAGAAEQAAAAPAPANPTATAVAAVKAAARNVAGRAGRSAAPMAGGAATREGVSGRWVRQGRKIIILGA